MGIKLKLLFMTFAIILIKISFTGAVSVDSDFITFYPGEENRVSVTVENNENFDIEEVSMRLVLERVPFTSVGSNEKDLDKIRDGREESTTFNLRPSTDITPGDYNIPYEIRYYEENEDKQRVYNGSFGVRVSARTDLDFSAYPSENAIEGDRGQVNLEIINKGLGPIKSISVEVIPEGFELLGQEKIFVGSIDSDDTDIINFDVIFKSTNPLFNAKITYKDFDNAEQTQMIAIPFKVYTKEEAKSLGLVTQSLIGLYVGIIIVLIIAWIIFRSVRKRKRRNNKNKS